MALRNVVNYEIGPIGGIEQSGVQKRRGFLTELISTREDALRLMLRLEREDQIPDHSRLTVRAFVRSALLEDAVFAVQQIKVEARVPVGSIAIASGDSELYEMVYFGRNTGSRNKSGTNYEGHRIAIGRAIFTHSVIQRVAEAGLLVDQGYSFRPLGGKAARRLSRGNFGDIAALMGVFRYSGRDVEEMLERGSNVIALARHSDRIVGISVAERADIPLDNGINVPIVEIVCASVDDAHRNKGLYEALSAMVIRQVALQHPDTVVLYSETNLEQTSLLRTAVRQGRRFAMDVSGTRYGILPAHATIDGTFKDSVVTFMDTHDLEQVLLSK